MWGEVFVCVLLGAVITIGLSVLKSVVTDRFFGIPGKIFMSVFLTAICAFAFAFFYFIIPTSTENHVVDEYEYVKNEEAAVYLHGDDYKHTTDVFLYKNAGDSTKVEVVKTEWKNIEDTIIETTLTVNKK